MFNALTFDKNIVKRAGVKCSRFYYAGKEKPDNDNVEFFYFVDENTNSIDGDNVYLSSLFLSDDIIDKVIDHVFTKRSKIIISACNTLDEVGTCDKLHGTSPIGLAHSYGLLENAYVSGAVYLDKDDVDLIIQSNAKIILTPSTSLGSGHGIPPLRMMLTLGADVSLGTGLSKYNSSGDIEFEKRLISLAVSGALCTREAISERDLQKMLKYS